MDITKAIEILDALASGYSPITGEAISLDSVLNERDVIRALQLAIDQLKTGVALSPSDVEIGHGDIQRAIQLFRDHGKKITANSLTVFFLGMRKFKNENIVEHELYGKYQNAYSKGKVLDFFTQYLLGNNSMGSKGTNDALYRNIDFFRKEKFNNLSDKAVDQLKQRISELGVLKKEDLSEQVVFARLKHPRAYEHWSEKEIELLSKAIKYTNDLKLLSECFQRGPGSIETLGQKIIYKSQLDNTVN
jgi:hypothetical protein